MKKNFLAVALLLISYCGYAQIPEDAIRHSWANPSGTARNQSIGGANVSLGGDITSLFLNPAGIGLYKTGEITFSPGFSFYGGKSSYRGTDNVKADNLDRFNVGTSGIVWGFSEQGKKWNTKTFSFGVNRTANFNSSTHYKGLNDYSSFSTEPTTEFYNYYQQNRNAGNTIGGVIDNAINDPSLSYSARMGLYTYLIDVDSMNNGTEQVFSRAEDILDNGGALMQENTLVTKGGITELAFGFAATKLDKLYIGGSLGVPIVSYKSHREFTESDATDNPNNDFGYMKYTEDYKSTGVGFNLKVGAIYKATDNLRFGLAIHTPTIFALKDNFNATMTTNTENLFPNDSVGSVDANYLNNGENPYSQYDMRSPARFMLSGTFLFGGGQQDVKNQKGFITADVEYVNHGWSHFSSGGDQYEGDEAFFKGVNNTVKDYYRGCLNYKIGGEVKLYKFMVRGGFSYYGNPYQDKDNLKASMMNISGGLGYRNKGIFVDIAYVQNITKDVNFPYRISTGDNTFATTKGSNGSVLATIGLKF